MKNSKIVKLKKNIKYRDVSKNLNLKGNYNAKNVNMVINLWMGTYNEDNFNNKNYTENNFINLKIEFSSLFIILYYKNKVYILKNTI